MEDSVKFIFKTLIKVPIIILVTYFVFNIFAFTFSYFKLLGFSYVVMQTAVENNFIPGDEESTLVSYAESLETYMLQNVSIYCDTDSSNDKFDTENPNELIAISGSKLTGDGSGETDNKKVQYGHEITVKVCANYVWIFPLINTGGSDGSSANAAGLTYNETTDIAVESSGTPDAEYNIVISYTVPGLKYYPDLS
jgi:uncharacterized membrane-anchored protein YitT (DUF2179 family)